jgi:anthranilate phosphoribosyltransferase
MTEAFSWPHILHKLLAGESLSEGESAAVMEEVMEGAATPAQIAGFLVALRAKGETTEEIVGLVRTMRSFAARVEVGSEVLDTCGTGGDRAGTFNVSTAAAIVCAGAGAKVAKHGNRAASSRCGSADVLEALGVVIDLPPEAVGDCIAAAGIGFCFAPLFHPAMRHAVGPRRELGVATAFNFLGPLTNPAGARRQALGISDRRMVDKMVAALGRLGSKHVIAFHGDSGLDELATSGPSEIVELKGGEISRYTLDPEDLGLERAPVEAISGGTADENAALLRGVIAGEAGPRRDVVVLNAAAGLVAAGLAPDIGKGLESAADAIDSGAARDALERFIETSNRLKG